MCHRRPWLTFQPPHHSPPTNHVPIHRTPKARPSGCAFDVWCLSLALPPSKHQKHAQIWKCKVEGLLMCICSYGLSGSKFRRQNSSGWCQNGLDECWKDSERTWLQLLSCPLIAHSVLIWKAESDREKGAETKVDIQTEVIGRHK